MASKWERRRRRLAQSWRFEVGRLRRVMQPRQRPAEYLSVARLHAMRVSIKRLRGMLRLMAKGPEKRRIAVALRDLARASSARRDFDVSCATLKRLNARPLMEVKSFRSRYLPSTVIRNGYVTSAKSIRKGLRRAERAESRARSQCRRKGRKATTRQLHEWRMRLKCLQYMREALGLRVPRSWIITARKLGEVHDWATLLRNYPEALRGSAYFLLNP